MKTLPSAITNLKNQLAVSGAWLTILGIYYPEYTGDYEHPPLAYYQYVNDNSDLIIGTGLVPGEEYSKWFKAAFQVQQITEEVQMSLPKITLTIYEPEPIPEYSLNLKDALQLYEGLSDGTVVLRRVYKSVAGTVTDVGIRQEFTILDSAMADTVITFSIGIADPLARRFPRDNYGALTCRHKYKGGFCRYAGEIKNPSFEDGMGFVNWSVWGVPPYTRHQDTIPVAGGPATGSCTGNGTKVYHHAGVVENVGSYQSGIALKAGAKYTLSGYVWLVSSITGGNGIRLQMLVNGVQQKALTDITLLNQWQRISVKFTAIADTTNSVLFIGGHGECYFDVINLSFDSCTHTLEDAPDGTPVCRSHNNSNQFGGSPGAAEGIFYNR